MSSTDHKPPLSYRDVALLDLARHAAMKAPFGLSYQQVDTDELWGALRSMSDEMGVAADVDPEPILDDLEKFAIVWAKDRAAVRANQSRS